MSHIFSQEGEFKVMDDKMTDILQKMKKTQSEVKSMQDQM
jgi:hypothetical protein